MSYYVFYSVLLLLLLFKVVEGYIKVEINNDL